MTPEMYAKLVTYVMAGILGLCVGSFLNVLIYRLPNGLNLAKPASHCPRCKQKIRAYDNIPVLSYLLLRGKCRYCKVKIPIRYTLVEIFNTMLWLFVVMAFYDEGYLSMVAKALVLSFLLVAFFTDLEAMIIPHTITIGLALSGIALCFSRDPVSLKMRLFGILLAGGGFLAVYFLSYLVYKREALGFGDVTLMAVLGFILGLKAVFFALFLATLTASVVLSVVRKVKKQGRGQEYPLAPFLTAAAGVALFFGTTLVDRYISLLTHF